MLDDSILYYLHCFNSFDIQAQKEWYGHGRNVIYLARFSLANGSVLSLHGYGLSSGVVVDVGEGHSAIVPVVDG